MDFVTRILWRLKWALVLAIVIGPLIAYGGYRDIQGIERIMAEGVLIEADVIGGREVSDRNGSSYSLNLAWRGEQGPQYREVLISSDLARQVIDGDMVTIDHATIRYLASDPERQIVILRDAPFKLATDRAAIWIGVIAGLMGLILAPLWFWMDHRRTRQEKARDEDIDATLARMRADNAQQS